MISKKKLWKEKEALIENIGLCNKYISQVRGWLNDIGLQYKNGLIGREEYHKLINEGLRGRSFRYYIDFYQDYIRRYEKRIKEIDEIIRKKPNLYYVLIVFVLLFALFSMKGGEITGYVVYNLVEGKADNLSLLIQENQNISTEVPEGNRLLSVKLTGRFEGEKLRIYMDSAQKSLLLFSCDGSCNLKEECGEACQISNNYDQIRIELDGRLHLEKIDYLTTKLSEFEISETNYEAALEENRYVQNSFSVLNPRQEDFMVSVYAEGELTKYTTIDKSLLEFDSGDSEKKVVYSIDLPYNISPGLYSENIVVRYLPKGSFTGEVPKDVHTVKVNVLGEKAAPGSYGLWVVVLVLVVVLVFNVGYFVWRRKN